ncbi:DUF6928 family protein [Flavobacterium sp. RNTU_13]|uniref:DUF6928 family protein n=1 Tax=Flavobacterium sp. RNTU_13 TaxID=3375145 RepID=UPI0039878201
MGWKASFIIVNKPKTVDVKTLLNELGFQNLTKIDDAHFEFTINPKENTVYVGNYKDNLLICTPDLPMSFFEDGESSAEKILNNFFSDSEICSIVLHSVVNLWGYSISRSGKKIRARAGSADYGTFVDLGNPVEEEKGLLSKSRLDENRNRVYSFEEFPDEELSEDQVGENFVFEICSRYFGEKLDHADDLLFETLLSGFEYGKTNVKNNQVKPNSTKKQWWKFW